MTGKLRILDRISDSVSSPTLIGEQGSQERYKKIRWVIIFWRLLVLVQISILLIVCPGCYFSATRALLLLGASLVYVVVYALFTARFPLTKGWRFYIFDLLIGVSLMFLARDASLIFLISFYSSTCLLSKSVTSFRSAFLSSTLMCLSFLAAISLAAPSHYSRGEILNYAGMFYFWGLAWVPVSRTVERLSILEMATHLNEQRKSIMRKLHDDLGNTLCGLHYRIQSLKRSEKKNVDQYLEYLINGYDRSSELLHRLLAGIDEVEEQRTLEDIAEATANEYGIHVKMAGPAGVVRLDPVVMREVAAIIREATANAIKHSGVDAVSVTVKKHKRRLEISIFDEGQGFSNAILEKKQSLGSLGIRGMAERMELIGGQFEVTSRKGVGTTITLVIGDKEGAKITKGTFIDSLIREDVYLLLMRLKVIILSLTVIQFMTLGSGLHTNPWVLLVFGAIVFEAFFWYLARNRILAVLLRVPSLIILDVLFFCFLFFVTWRADIPMLVAEPVSMAIAASAYFVGVKRNVALAGLLVLGIILASALAPPDSASAIDRTEMVVTYVTENLVIATLAGFLVEFIKGLGNVHSAAIESALFRERERVSKVAHREMGSAVQNLKHEIDSLRTGIGASISVQEKVARIEELSTDLKLRLRRILNHLEESIETSAVE